MIRIFSVTILIVALVLGAVAGWGYAAFTQPGALRQPVAVYIDPESSLNRIAEVLTTKGVIEQPLVFGLGVRISGMTTRLRAGEFSFPAGVSPVEVARILESGETVLRRVTFAEGLTTAEVMARLMKVEGLHGFVAESASEGSLLPETYYFSYGDDRMELIQRMRTAMMDTLETLWSQRADDLPLATPAEALILASIVEKETGIAEERARVAAVFINRLRKGMRLQSDPTVVYGITGGSEALGRRLTRADLQALTPYNTYRIDGLPPGPIANPGRAAISAVLNPMETDEYYFVADGTGGHHFARTLEEHNRNVRRWRDIRDRQ